MKKSFGPTDVDPALAALIEKTIKSAGDIDPETLPHYVRQQLAGRINGDISIEAYVRNMARKRDRQS